MSKRITRLSKLSKSEKKDLLTKIVDAELKVINVHLKDGDHKAVYYFNNDEEYLVILDNKAKPEVEEKEIEKLMKSLEDNMEESILD